MTQETFLLKIEEELELSSKIKLDTYLTDLEEWDSITALVLIGYVSNEFGVKLTQEDIESFTTLQSIIQRIGVNKFD